jgi:hypothetical protein
MTPPQQQFGESGGRRIQNWVKAVVATDNGLFKAHKFGRLTAIPLVKIKLICHSLHNREIVLHVARLYAVYC